jgi:enamine deaminase RidA (YjgF/YER057c/UK114 family)
MNAARFFWMVLLTALAATTVRAEPKVICFSPNKQTGTSLAIVMEPAPLAHTTQLLPLTPEGRIVGLGNVALQAEAVLNNLNTALRSADSSLARIVKLNVYLASDDLRESVEKTIAPRFQGKIQPAITFVSGQLSFSNVLVAMDAVALSDRNVGTVATTREKSLPTVSNETHVAILPAGGAVYVAGMAEKGTLTDATIKTLEKLTNAIAHLGLGMSDIVQLKAFLNPMTEAEAVRAALRSFFAEKALPPVVLVDWISTTVPIEIELIAAASAGLKTNEPVAYITPPGTTASPVYSRMAQVNFGNRIYVSGLSGTGEPENDVKEIYATLEEVLKKAGGDFSNLAKATYYWSDPKSNARLDALRPKIYDPQRPPTASKARVSAVGKAGKGIVIDMIGVVAKAP